MFQCVIIYALNPVEVSLKFKNMQHVNPSPFCLERVPVSFLGCLGRCAKIRYLGSCLCEIFMSAD